MANTPWNFAASAETATGANTGLEDVDANIALTQAGIDRAREAEMAATPIEGQKYFTVKNVDKNNYVLQGMNGIGLVQINGDAEDLPSDNQSIGFSTTITNYVMRLMMSITKEMLETDRYGVIGKHGPQLMASSRKTIERILADGPNRGFGTDDLSFLCEDGLGPFSAGRTQPKEGLAAWSNLETSGALTTDMIATARLNFKQYLNSNGDLDPQIMAKVICSSDLEDTMRILSGTTLDVNTSLNDINPVSGTAYEVWNWLDADTALFEGDAENGMEFHARVNPSIITFADGSNPDIIRSRVRMALGTGCTRNARFRGLIVS